MSRIANPAVRARRPMAASRALKPPLLLPGEPLPVLGASGVEPGPGVLAPSTMLTLVGVAVGVDVGVLVGVGMSGVGVGRTGVGVGVTMMTGVQFTVQAGGGGVQLPGTWQPGLTWRTLVKLAVPVPPAGTTIPVWVPVPRTT